MEDTQTTGGNTPETPPLTFESAYAADTSPVSTDTTAQTTTPPAAAVPASPQDLPQPTDDRSPYVTRARFDEVNGRMKTAEEWKQQRGWAEQVDQQTYAEMSKWYQRAAQDPEDFFGESILEHPRAVEILQSVIGRMSGHAVHGERLMSLAGSALAKGRGQQAAPAAVDLNPIAVELADGRVIQVHTAEQVAAREQQLIAQQDQKYAPALQTAAELKQEREQAAVSAATTKWMGEFYPQIESLPNYAEVKPKMAADLDAMIKAGQVGDNTFDLENAVRSLYIKHALPLRDATAQSRQLDDLQRKAAASTGINPGSAAPTSPRRPMSFDDKSLKW